MTGDSQRQDDDFLDDDFVIEDIAGKNDELEQLFTTPAVAKRPGATESVQDADDLLFTDHTQGLNPSEKFQGGPSFGETNNTQWNGESLELDEVGVPGDVVKSPDGELEAAEERFATELGSLLKKEKDEDFALDSEAELELVGQAPAADGISEIEQSGPFVLDDGEGNWQPDDEAVAEPVVGDDAEVVGVGAADAAGDEAAGDDAMGDGSDAELRVGLQDEAQEAPIEPGWEPLPATSMDQLSEVGEVARVDGEGEDGAASPEEEPATASELAAVEGHDLYAAEAPAPVLVGPRKAAGLGASALRALVAATLLFGTGAAVVLRPQWFGLRVEPERVQNARIERPKVDVALAPPTVAAAKPTPKGMPTPVTQKPVGNDPMEGVPKPADPVAVAPQPQPGQPTSTPVVPTTPVETPPKPTTPVETPPKPTTPVAVVEPSPPTPEPQPSQPATAPEATPVAPTPVAVAQPPVTPTPVNPTVDDAKPIAATPLAATPPVVAPEPSAPSVAAPKVGPDAWPVAKGDDRDAAGAAKPTRLVRVGDDLMVGDVSEGKRPAGIVDGVLPGSRAFAQLHNGNYFIGSIKCVGDQTITLRIGEGEVTLPTVEVARLTELGSSDYEALQKATAGSVRLTNNNRLVGGIMSHVADDHIVIEFRSNRVMLPRSAVGEVLQGEGAATVRLDVTREEDDWVKNLAERQLGTGAGPALIPERVKGESGASQAGKAGDGKTAAGGKSAEKLPPPAPDADRKAKPAPKTQPATPPPGRQR
jgi:hypothetical protein